MSCSQGKVAAAALRAAYKERFSVTWGDSTKTLPNLKEKFDVIIIDGGVPSLSRSCVWIQSFFVPCLGLLAAL